MALMLVREKTSDRDARNILVREGSLGREEKLHVRGHESRWPLCSSEKRLLKQGGGPM